MFRYSAIRHLPLAKDLVRASRQQLVAHLDAYSKRHRALFEKARACAPPLYPKVLRLSAAASPAVLAVAPACMRPPLACTSCGLLQLLPCCYLSRSVRIAALTAPACWKTAIVQHLHPGACILPLGHLQLPMLVERTQAASNQLSGRWQTGLLVAGVAEKALHRAGCEFASMHCDTVIEVLVAGSAQL